jgi:hypothetical protein
MFESAEKRSNKHIRIRKIALIAGAASLLVFVAAAIWDQVKSSQHENSIFTYYPSDFEAGLTFGAILGGIFSAISFGLSFIIEKLSKK